MLELVSKSSQLSKFLIELTFTKPLVGAPTVASVHFGTASGLVEFAVHV